jgi:hypothetical protein
LEYLIKMKTIIEVIKIKKLIILLTMLCIIPVAFASVNTADLIRFWDFEDGTPNTDYINSEDVTVSATARSTAVGYSGKGYDLGANGDQVRILENGLTFSDLTFCYWHNYIATTGWIYNSWPGGTTGVWLAWKPTGSEFVMDSGGEHYSSSSRGASSGWKFRCTIRDKTGGYMRFYESGTLYTMQSISSHPTTITHDQSTGISFGARSDGSAGADFWIDEIMVWDTALTEAEMDAIYDAYVAGDTMHDYLTTPSSLIIDWDSIGLTPTNNTLSYSTDTIFNFNITGLGLTNANCSLYWNSSLVDSDTSMSANTTLSLTKSSIPVGTNATIESYLSCIGDNGITNTSTTKTIIYDIPDNTPYVYSNVLDYTTLTDDFTLELNFTNINGSVSCGAYDNSSFVSCSQDNLNGNYSNVTCSVSNELVMENVLITPYCTNGTITNATAGNIYIDTHNLEVTAQDWQSGNNISNVFVVVNGSSFNNTGSDITYVYGTGTENISIFAVGYATNYENVTFSSSVQEVSTTLYEANMIKINIFDTTTTALNDTNITLSKSGFSQTNNTGANDYIVYYVDSGNYTIDIDKSDYADSTYYVELSNNSYILIDLYLEEESNTLARTFTIREALNNSLVTNALLTFYREINATDVVVTQKYSDFSGQALVYLDPTQPHTLRVTYPTYLAKEVSFTPTETSYTIYIGEGFTPTYESIFDDISYSILPTYTILSQNTSYTFNFSISEANGNLEYWGLKVDNTGDITNNNITGQPSGSNTDITITTGVNSTAYLPVQVTYYFKTGSMSEEWTLTKLYYAYPTTALNNSVSYVFDDLEQGDFSDLAKAIIIAFSLAGLLGTIVFFTRVRNGYLLTWLAIIMLSFWAYVGWFDWWLWAIITIPIILLSVIKISEGNN